MKLAIVPALALAAAGSVALMASPAAATPEVGQPKAGAPNAMMQDGKWYGQHDDHKGQNTYVGEICNIYQYFPGTSVGSGVITAPVNTITTVITQTANLLGIELSNAAAIDSGCP